MPVRYCQIAIFQGFGVAIPGLESGLKNSRRGGGEMAVLGCLSAAINLPPKRSSICASAFPWSMIFSENRLHRLQLFRIML
jgi:hypothetical protein